MTQERLGYMRISTAAQDPSLQHDALTKAGCSRVFRDTASGKLGTRAGLDGLLDRARPGDVVVVWRLDRLGRSLRHLLDIVAELDERKIGFISLTENIDTTTPGGKLIFHIFGAIAEFERDLIRERTKAGLAAAGARGRRGGRPTVWTDEKLRAAAQMHANATHDIASIARALGVSRASVYRALASRHHSRDVPVSL